LVWAAFGFGGAFVFAASQVIPIVFGDNEVTTQARRRAWARFGVALLFGPLAAGALTGDVVRWSGNRMGAVAVALAIGLSANALWPVFVDEAGKGVKRWLGGWLKGLGSQMTDEDGKK
jgi:hypothetical protein